MTAVRAASCASMQWKRGKRLAVQPIHDLKQRHLSMSPRGQVTKWVQMGAKQPLRMTLLRRLQTGHQGARWDLGFSGAAGLNYAGLALGASADI